MSKEVLAPDLDMVQVRARLNPRQERFCQAMVRGSSVLGAYLEAYSDLDQGGAPERDSEHARRVHQHPAVQRRLADLAAAAEVTAEWVVRQGKRIVETAESETAQVQALTLLGRMFPHVFSTGGAGGQSTRVNVIAGAGAQVQVTTLGAGMTQDESRAIAEHALREVLAQGGGAGADVIDVEAREVPGVGEVTP